MQVLCFYMILSENVLYPYSRLSRMSIIVIPGIHFTVFCNNNYYYEEQHKVVIRRHYSL